MPLSTLEERVAALEQQMAALMNHVLAPPIQRDWRSTVGMFTGDTLMQEIDEEGRKIREADREQAQRDHS